MSEGERASTRAGRESVEVDFRYAGGEWRGRALIEEWHERRETVRVRPEGWTHGIWIGRNEIV